MKQTFANLPSNIDVAIRGILSQEAGADWVKRASILHEQYTNRSSDKQKKRFVFDKVDSLAYLALRAPATYAQIYSTLLALKEVLPSWQPKTMLDIGSGPGTGVWAAQNVWPELTEAVCIDRNKEFISLGKYILSQAHIPIVTTWQLQDLQRIEETEKQFDLIIVANVLNELNVGDGEKLLGRAFNMCRGMMIVVEPGTPFGSSIVASVAKKFANAGTLLAPYIENSFVEKKEYWLHFPQRFIRPEFTRRIRQHMRDSSLMASDWEEAKYSYVAISKIPGENTVWGRCVGPVRVQKGFLEVPILTKDEIVQMKVMKRDKEKYAAIKALAWGDLIKEPLRS